MQRTSLWSIAIELFRRFYQFPASPEIIAYSCLSVCLDLSKYKQILGTNWSIADFVRFSLEFTNATPMLSLTTLQI